MNISGDFSQIDNVKEERLEKKIKILWQAQGLNTEKVYPRTTINDGTVLNKLNYETHQI